MTVMPTIFARVAAHAERFGAMPFTVYVTTGMSTGTIDAWWLGLAGFLINTHDRIELPHLDCPVDCADQAAKKQAYVAITKRVHSVADALPAVKAAIAAVGIDSAALAQREALSNEQLRRLAASPLVTVAHIVSGTLTLRACPRPKRGGK